MQMILLSDVKYMPTPFSLFDYITQVMTGEEYKI